MGVRPIERGNDSHGDGWADAPPILFLFLTKRERAAPGVREKSLWRAPVQWPSARRESVYRCKRRFEFAFGHAILFCNFWNCRPVADGAEVNGVQGRI